MRTHRESSRPTPGRIALTFGAMVCTGIGLNTAWHFAGDHLYITDSYTRVALCGAGEIVLISLALAARDNLRNPLRRAAGLPGLLMWAVTAVLAVPAFAEASSQAAALGGGSGLSAGIVRTALGPIGAAFLWHLAMGIELRQREGDARSNGALARLSHRAQQMVLSWFGVADRDESAEEIARARAADRAVYLADRVALAPESSRRYRRRAARLAEAIDGARHGLEGADADAAESAIVGRIVRRKSVAALASIEAQHDWTASLPSQRKNASESESTETRESTGGESFDAPESPVPVDVDQGESFDAGAVQSETEETGGDYTDVTMNAAALMAHEPPPWSSLTLRQAVAKADEILPNRTAPMLSQTLAEVGIEASPASIRSTRSALRRTATREDA